MVLLIDNYDSFTYNLYQQLEACGARTHVAANDAITIEEIKKLNLSGIIISPGPGRPEQSGICMEVIKHFHMRIPILGVCLGHECMGAVFGARVVHAQRIMHGKTSRIYHRGTDMFKGIKNPFYAARYHSLALQRVPEGFTLSAWDARREIMAITHTRYPLYGIQFHPESFMTEEGGKVIENFLYAH